MSRRSTVPTTLIQPIVSLEFVKKVALFQKVLAKYVDTLLPSNLSNCVQKPIFNIESAAVLYFLNVIFVGARAPTKFTIFIVK